jgi:hypothetical protein
MGHAIFDVLDIPLLGRAEDAADQFATYLMLHLGKDQARRLISGAAYSYNSYLGGPRVTVPLVAFADAHSAPMQRFFNLLCMAYGADRDAFGEVVEKGWLPPDRARNCPMEFGEVNFAFKKLIEPSIDEELGKKAMDKTWLPNPHIRLFPSPRLSPPPQAMQSAK